MRVQDKLRYLLVGVVYPSIQCEAFGFRQRTFSPVCGLSMDVPGFLNRESRLAIISIEIAGKKEDLWRKIYTGTKPR